MEKSYKEKIKIEKHYSHITTSILVFNSKRRAFLTSSASSVILSLICCNNQKQLVKEVLNFMSKAAKYHDTYYINCLILFKQAMDK